MANITVDNLQSKTIRSNDKREKVLDILLSEVDWMHACGGKGRCTTCKAKILEGMPNLSKLTDAERRYRDLNQLKEDERLTCQIQLFGDVKVEVPKAYQLPHLNYSS